MKTMKENQRNLKEIKISSNEMEKISANERNVISINASKLKS
jgi:hypothetical protein